MLDIEQRVALGVAHMDENYPNWRDRIDPETFDIRNTNHCVFGQVLGSFYDQSNSSRTIYRCGFDATYWDEDAYDFCIDISKYDGEAMVDKLEQQYVDLQAEWLKVFAA